MYTSTHEIYYPKNFYDVQKIVRIAAQQGKKISVAGARRSQAKVTFSNSSDALVIDTKYLNRVQIDEKRKVALVESGALFHDLQMAANKSRLAVKVMQASPVFSVGGSISANCHGWDQNAGNIGHTIESLTIVDAKGDIRQLYPRDPLFQNIVGGWGLFGVIVEAKIRLTDNTEMLTKELWHSVEGGMQYFDQNIKGHDALYRYRICLANKGFFKRGLVQVSYPLEQNSCVESRLVKEQEYGKPYERVALGSVRILPTIKDLFWIQQKVRGNYSYIQSRNEIMRPAANAAFREVKGSGAWLQEYFVTPDKMPEFVTFLGKTLKENRVNVLNASLRFVKADCLSSSFNYTKQKDVYALVLFFNQKLSQSEVQRSQEWIRQVVDKALELEGSFYLPYPHLATKDQVKKAYDIDYILAQKKMYDPNGLFTHGLFEEFIC
jgi:FAD/FMN-containing dehydrogenase